MRLLDKLNCPKKALKEINKDINYSSNGLSYVYLTLDDKNYIKHYSFICSKCNEYLDEGYLVYEFGDILCPKCFEEYNKNIFLTEFRKRMQDDVTTYRWFLAHFDEDVKQHRHDII